MRNIKFRGKSCITNKFIFGDLVRNIDGRLAIIPPFKDGMDNHCDKFEVIEETVGQFTGLNDKNGKEVYINDIVRTKYERLCIVKWFHSPCQIGINLKPIEIEHQYPSSYDLYLSENLEVIGNIYDNQELIK